MGDTDLALAHHHYFKDDFIARLPYGRNFELPADAVYEWLENLDDARRDEAARFLEANRLRLTPTDEELFADPEFRDEYYWRELVELRRRAYREAYEDTDES